MTKHLLFLIGLFFVFNMFNSSTYNDLEKLINVPTKASINSEIKLSDIPDAFNEVNSILKEYENIDDELEALQRIEYRIGNNIISFELLTKYFNLKIQRLNTPETKTLLFISYLFLFASLLSFIVSITLLIAFIIKTIVTKNRLEYLKEKSRVYLVRLGSFSCGAVVFLMAFLRVLNA